MSYIYTAEGGIHIANTRNHTSGTSGDSDKCNSFNHIQGNALCRRPPPPTHAHAHTTHMCTYMHTSSYVNETFS